MSTCTHPHRRGPNKWRDMHYPVDILDEWCKNSNLPEPEWASDNKSVVIDGTKYSLDQFGECKDSYTVVYVERVGCVCISESLLPSPASKYTVCR